MLQNILSGIWALLMINILSATMYYFAYTPTVHLTDLHQVTCSNALNCNYHSPHPVLYPFPNKSRILLPLASGGKNYLELLVHVSQLHWVYWQFTSRETKHSLAHIQCSSPIHFPSKTPVAELQSECYFICCDFIVVLNNKISENLLPANIWLSNTNVKVSDLLVQHALFLVFPLKPY